jgi:hypothetical protein
MPGWKDALRRRWRLAVALAIAVAALAGIGFIALVRYLTLD